MKHFDVSSARTCFFFSADLIVWPLINVYDDMYTYVYIGSPPRTGAVPGIGTGTGTGNAIFFAIPSTTGGGVRSTTGVLELVSFSIPGFRFRTMWSYFPLYSTGISSKKLLAPAKLLSGSVSRH